MSLKKNVYIIITIIMIVGTVFTTFITSVFVYFEIESLVKKRVNETAFSLATIYDKHDLYKLKNISSNIVDLRIVISDKDKNIIYDSDFIETRKNNVDNRSVNKLDINDLSSDDVSFFYKTIKVDKNYYLTLITETETFANIYLNILWKVIMIFLLYLVLIVIILKMVVDRTVKNITNIDLDNPIKTNTYDEFSNLAKKIEDKNNIIETQLQSIRAQKIQLDLILENSPKGLIILNDEGKISYANNIIFSTFKIKDDVSGKGFLEVFNDDCFRKIYAATIERKDMEAELNYKGNEFLFTVVNISSEVIDRLNIKNTESHGCIIYIESRDGGGSNNKNSSNDSADKNGKYEKDTENGTDGDSKNDSDKAKTNTNDNDNDDDLKNENEEKLSEEKTVEEKTAESSKDDGESKIESNSEASNEVIKETFSEGENKSDNEPDNKTDNKSDDESDKDSDKDIGLNI